MPVPFVANGCEPLKNFTVEIDDETGSVLVWIIPGNRVYTLGWGLTEKQSNQIAREMFTILHHFVQVKGAPFLGIW